MGTASGPSGLVGGDLDLVPLQANVELEAGEVEQGGPAEPAAMSAMKGLHNGLPIELIQGNVGVDRRGEAGAAPHGAGAKLGGVEVGRGDYQTLQPLAGRRVVVHDRDNWVRVPRLTHGIRLRGIAAT
jgi:hypothetical protein